MKIQRFQPSQEWFEDWPFDIYTVVRIQAIVSGAAAGTAVENFQSELHRDPTEEQGEGTRSYYWGGFTAEISEKQDRWEIEISSSGQDGFESARAGAEQLTDAVANSSGDVELSWKKLPAQKSERS